jgi:DNA-cytosine methyltransferase
MIEQLNLFDGHIPYFKITKPVRLIELFAGIGSQHQALKNLGVKIDRSTIVEWQVNSIQAYNDIHIRKYDDHTQGLSKEQLAQRLKEFGISLDYNEPAKIETLMRKGEDWLRNVYNNIINTNNKVNIMSVKGKDLNITETDKYDYILTYSFPCQDLSKAGKGKGMTDTTTRSGLLWEVERILSELTELPQILLMENVPDVIGSRYIGDFKRWDERLRELGYSNHIEILNAKNYGVPQNRERAFMISILGNYLYKFPNTQPLTLRLKDMLEKEVDEKYYLSDIQLNHIQNTKYESMGIDRVRDINEETINTITTMGGGNREPKIKEMVFKSKDKRLPEMLDKIDFNSTEPQSLDLYNRTVSDISQTLTMPNHNAQAIVVPETKEYANYITWLDDKGRINTQDHRAYFEDRLSGTIPAMERGVPNVLLNEQRVEVIANIRNNGTSQSGNVYDKEQLSPTLCATDYKNPPKVVDTKETIIYDDYNSTIRKDQDTIGTITTMIGRDSERHGFKLIEKTNQLRIRKLTPRECYRLMGFGDKAFDLAAPNQSNSSLYHQAGDSIVVNVLEALFKELL